MADTAAHLVGNVFPHVPVRQWVLSVPRSLRYYLAKDAERLTRVLRIFISEIFRRYLPDDILVKVDRAAMGVSLETRVPYLDPRVIEFALRLPMSCKVREGEEKWILRRILDRHVPRELVERPKMGFALPLAAWLRGPLRDWAEELLGERRLRESGLRPEPVRKLWEAHLAGRVEGQHALWDVLMYEAWLKPAGT